MTLVNQNEVFSKFSQPWIKDRTIFLTLHGSHVYGLNTESSDIDLKGFLIAPKKIYLGYNQSFEQAEGKEPYDMVIYEFRKFFKLAADCNPNIIEVLHTSPSMWVKINKFGQLVIDNKDKFLSLKAKHTFSGYAVAQLKRINTHRKWLLNPPTTKPTREEFGLPENTIVSADQLGAAETEIQKKIESYDFNWAGLEPSQRIEIQRSISSMFTELNLTSEDVWYKAGKSIGFQDNFLEFLKTNRAYSSKLTEWTQYRSWLTNRNPKRAAIEQKYGYDCKHASHLVRLLKMAKEIVTTGKVNVERTEDREELLAIKNNGIWTYDELINWATKQDQEITEAYKVSTVLPKEPPKEYLETLCQNILTEALDREIF